MGEKFLYDLNGMTCVFSSLPRTSFEWLALRKKNFTSVELDREPSLF